MSLDKEADLTQPDEGDRNIFNYLNELPVVKLERLGASKIERISPCKELDFSTDSFFSSSDIIYIGDSDVGTHKCPGDEIVPREKVVPGKVDDPLRDFMYIDDGSADVVIVSCGAVTDLAAFGKEGEGLKERDEIPPCAAGGDPLTCHGARDSDTATNLVVQDALNKTQGTKRKRTRGRPRKYKRLCIPTVADAGETDHEGPPVQCQSLGSNKKRQRKKQRKRTIVKGPSDSLLFNSSASSDEGSESERQAAADGQRRSSQQASSQSRPITRSVSKQRQPEKCPEHPSQSEKPGSSSMTIAFGETLSQTHNVCESGKVNEQKISSSELPKKSGPKRDTIQSWKSNSTKSQLPKKYSPKGEPSKCLKSNSPKSRKSSSECAKKSILKCASSQSVKSSSPQSAQQVKTASLHAGANGAEMGVISVQKNSSPQKTEGVTLKTKRASPKCKGTSPKHKGASPKLKGASPQVSCASPTIKGTSPKPKSASKTNGTSPNTKSASPKTKMTSVKKDIVPKTMGTSRTTSTSPKNTSPKSKGVSAKKDRCSPAAGAESLPSKSQRQRQNSESTLSGSSFSSCESPKTPKKCKSQKESVQRSPDSSPSKKAYNLRNSPRYSQADWISDFSEDESIDLPNSETESNSSSSTEIIEMSDSAATQSEVACTPKSQEKNTRGSIPSKKTPHKKKLPKETGNTASSKLPSPPKSKARVKELKTCSSVGKSGKMHSALQAAKKSLENAKKVTSSVSKVNKKKKKKSGGQEDTRARTERSSSRKVVERRVSGQIGEKKMVKGVAFRVLSGSSVQAQKIEKVLPKCVYCDHAVFTKKLELHKHVERKHKFRCGRCKTTFANKFDKEQHLLNHVKEFHTCVPCGETYRTPFGIKHHWSSRMHRTVEALFQRVVNLLSPLVPQVKDAAAGADGPVAGQLMLRKKGPAERLRDNVEIVQDESPDHNRTEEDLEVLTLDMPAPNSWRRDEGALDFLGHQQSVTKHLDKNNLWSLLEDHENCCYYESPTWVRLKDIITRCSRSQMQVGLAAGTVQPMSTPATNPSSNCQASNGNVEEDSASLEEILQSIQDMVSREGWLESDGAPEPSSSSQSAENDVSGPCPNSEATNCADGSKNLPSSSFLSHILSEAPQSTCAPTTSANNLLSMPLDFDYFDIIDEIDPQPNGSEQQCSGAEAPNTLSSVVPSNIPIVASEPINVYEQPSLAQTSETSPVENPDITKECMSDMPSRSEGHPVTSSDVEGRADGTANAADDIPADSDDIPADSDDIHANSDDILADSDDIPADSDDIPADSEEALLSSESTISANETGEVTSSVLEMPLEGDGTRLSSNESTISANETGVVTGDVAEVHPELGDLSNSENGENGGPSCEQMGPGKEISGGQTDMTTVEDKVADETESGGTKGLQASPLLAVPAPAVEHEKVADNFANDKQSVSEAIKCATSKSSSLDIETVEVSGKQLELKTDLLGDSMISTDGALLIADSSNSNIQPSHGYEIFDVAADAQEKDLLHHSAAVTSGNKVPTTCHDGESVGSLSASVNVTKRDAREIASSLSLLTMPSCMVKSTESAFEPVVTSGISATATTLTSAIAQMTASKTNGLVVFSTQKMAKASDEPAATSAQNTSPVAMDHAYALTKGRPAACMTPTVGMSSTCTSTKPKYSHCISSVVVTVASSFVPSVSDGLSHKSNGSCEEIKKMPPGSRRGNTPTDLSKGFGRQNSSAQAASASQLSGHDKQSEVKSRNYDKSKTRSDLAGDYCGQFDEVGTSEDQGVVDAADSQIMSDNEFEKFRDCIEEFLEESTSSWEAPSQLNIHIGEQNEALDESSLSIICSTPARKYLNIKQLSSGQAVNKEVYSRINKVFSEGVAGISPIPHLTGDGKYAETDEDEEMIMMEKDEKENVFLGVEGGQNRPGKDLDKHCSHPGDTDEQVSSNSKTQDAPLDLTVPKEPLKPMMEQSQSQENSSPSRRPRLSDGTALSGQKNKIDGKKDVLLKVQESGAVTNKEGDTDRHGSSTGDFEIECCSFGALDSTDPEESEKITQKTVIHDVQADANEVVGVVQARDKSEAQHNDLSQLLSSGNCDVQQTRKNYGTDENNNTKLPGCISSHPVHKNDNTDSRTKFPFWSLKTQDDMTQELTKKPTVHVKPSPAAIPVSMITSGLNFADCTMGQFNQISRSGNERMQSPWFGLHSTVLRPRRALLPTPPPGIPCLLNLEVPHSLAHGVDTYNPYDFAYQNSAVHPHGIPQGRRENYKPPPRKRQRMEARPRAPVNVRFPRPVYPRPYMGRMRGPPLVQQMRNPRSLQERPAPWCFPPSQFYR